MNTLYPNQISHISQIIERTRREEESFLPDSKKAATDIMQYLYDEKIIGNFSSQIIVHEHPENIISRSLPKEKGNKNKSAISKRYPSKTEAGRQKENILSLL